MGKSTISIAMFNSELLVITRGFFVSQWLAKSSKVLTRAEGVGTWLWATNGLDVLKAIQQSRKWNCPLAMNRIVSYSI